MDKQNWLKEQMWKTGFDRLIDDVRRKSEIVMVELEVPDESLLDWALHQLQLTDEQRYPQSTYWFWRAHKDHWFKVTKQF